MNRTIMILIEEYSVSSFSEFVHFAKSLILSLFQDFSSFSPMTWIMQKNNAKRMTASFSNESSMSQTLVSLLYRITSCSHKKPWIKGITIFLRSISSFLFIESYDLNNGKRIMQKRMTASFSNESSMSLTLVMLLYRITSCSYKRP